MISFFLRTGFLVACLTLCAWSSGAVQAKELPDFTELVAKQGGAVVNISTVSNVGRARRGRTPGPELDEDDPMFEFFHRFFPRQPGMPGLPLPGMPQQGESQSMGSGFITSADGYILTNAHVVEGADQIVVRLTDKREFKAKMIGADRRTDVALIKIEARDLPVVTLGEASKLRVGEWVVAIGSPFGFENSVTAGIVSAKGRELPQENLVPFIQTDVAINPGNSGGPLFNMKGQVVGINSQIYSRSGGYMGVSFAIPIDVAMDVQNQLRTAGRVSRGRIGVVIQEVSRELADSFGLAKAAGALVASVERGGPAEQAGLESGDIITRFASHEVSSSSELPRVVTAVRPGTRVPVQIWRKGGFREVMVTVAEVSEEKSAGMTRPVPSKEMSNALGLVLTEVSPQQKQKLGISGGLLVQENQGAAARNDLRRGDILLAVISNGTSTELKTVDQFNRLLSQMGRNALVTLLVRRGDMQTFVSLRTNGEK